MPILEQKVIKEDGKPRKFINTLTFFPEDKDNLRNSDMIADIPDHWNKDGGFFCPDPEQKDTFIKVYLQSYDKDDSNPSAKKRYIVQVEIQDYEEVNSSYPA